MGTDWSDLVLAIGAATGKVVDEGSGRTVVCTPFALNVWLPIGTGSEARGDEGIDDAFAGTAVKTSPPNRSSCAFFAEVAE
jgi:hypothetical protein